MFFSFGPAAGFALLILFIISPLLDDERCFCERIVVFNFSSADSSGRSALLCVSLAFGPPSTVVHFCRRFWSPLALLVVVLSLFSVCDLSHLCAARGLLQAACSSSITSGSRLAPPTPPLSIAPLRDRWFAVGALAPRRHSLLQRGLLSWRTGISVRSLGCFSDPCVSFSRCFSFTCLAEMSLSLLRRLLHCVVRSGQPPSHCDQLRSCVLF